MRVIRLLLTAGACGLVASSGVHALGFGRVPANVTLGSPLDLAVPVRLDGDDGIEPECVSAEVHIGERRVPQHNLRWALEAGATPQERLVRVQTLVVVDEPVIAVQIAVGCPPRISRRFTAFADPPFTADGVALPAVASVRAGQAPAVGGPSASAAAVKAAPGATPATVPAAAGPRLPVATPAERARSAPRARRPGSQSARPAVARQPPPAALAAPVPAASSPAVRAPAPGSRLALDAADPAWLAQLARQQAQADEAAQAASAATAAASAAEAQLRRLEQRLEGLQADGRRQQEELAQLRSRAARHEAAGSRQPWLLAALVLSLAAVGWLVWQLRRQQRAAQSQWYADAAAVLADARPDAAAGPDMARTPVQAATAGKLRAGSPAPPGALAAGRPATNAAAAQRPEPMHEAAEARSGPPTLPGRAASAAPVSTLLAPVTVEPWSDTSPPPRPVSADELIDLEQQAEFFVVLGQDEAAIDLLVSHLRDTGGTSPLPYLKLLEIHRRRGDAEAYERMRQRFNQRFNAYAPDWAHDLQQGRTLEDYPQVMQRLQRLWPAPLDAMADLETLLFRKEGGELFDLPAYREVLMLYALARELYDLQGADLAAVDVLLPLPSSPDGEPPPGIGEATMVLTPEARLATPALDLDLGSAPPARR